MYRTDQQCIRDCLNGHPEVFRHLVSRHQAALMGYLRSRVGNEDQAAEAAQETFVRAYFALRTLNKLGSFFSWILGIADRVLKETWRDQKRNPKVAFDERQMAATPAQPDNSPALDVTEAVDKLPDMYREVVLLRYYGGHSCAEISRNLDLPIGTVTKRLSRAYALLRECLSETNRMTLKVAQRDEDSKGSSEVKS